MDNFCVKSYGSELDCGVDDIIERDSMIIWIY